MFWLLGFLIKLFAIVLFIGFMVIGGSDKWLAYAVPFAVFYVGHMASSFSRRLRAD